MFIGRLSTNPCKLAIVRSMRFYPDSLLYLGWHSLQVWTVSSAQLSALFLLVRSGSPEIGKLHVVLLLLDRKLYYHI